MTVAVQIEFSDGADSLLLESILLLAKEHPDTRFVVFCTRKTYSSTDWGTNCSPQLVQSSIARRLYLHYWCQLKLPLLLKKHKASIFISENGFCALRSPTPQIMLIKDNGCLGKKKGLMDIFQRYRNRHFEKFSGKAAAICFPKAYLERSVISQYPALAAKTSTFSHGIEPLFGPLNPVEKMAVLEQKSGGVEYFVCDCSALTSLHLIMVLKAFSIFKKRLKSGFKLIFLNRLGPNPVADFHLYKYRKDVQMITPASTMEESVIIASAYAAIFLPANPTLSNWGLKCMKSQVPLITLNDAESMAIYEDAAIITAADETSLAERLMQLYKDEGFRHSHLLKAVGFANHFNWDDSACWWWQTILRHQHH